MPEPMTDERLDELRKQYGDQWIDRKIAKDVNDLLAEVERLRKQIDDAMELWNKAQAMKLGTD